MAAAAEGFYCSTSGTVFTSKDELNEHYRSDFHRYNLRRKVAGLPPVTLDWFEARKEQLRTTAAPTAKGTQQWIDPLTRKKFASEATYRAFVSSNKYDKLLKEAGLQVAPEPLMVTKQAAPVVAPVPPRAATEHAEPSNDADDGSSGWETASDNGTHSGGMRVDRHTPLRRAGEEEWEAWDVRRSLFDNHVATSFEANLEYMYKRFGFYLPDAECLTDAEGLVQYLGQKLQYGHVPLYLSGDDPNAKSFRSLHAVQRHMVDAGRCKMLYDGNEDEYAEFYDYEQPAEEAPHDGAPQSCSCCDHNAAPSSKAGSHALATAPAPAVVAAGGYELVLPDEGPRGKVLGSRELAVYYRQRHRPADGRASTTATALVAAYRRLGVATAHQSDDVEASRARKALAQANKLRLKQEMRNAVIHKLPKNVTF